MENRQYRPEHSAVCTINTPELGQVLMQYRRALRPPAVTQVGPGRCEVDFGNMRVIVTASQIQCIPTNLPNKASIQLWIRTRQGEIRYSL